MTGAQKEALEQARKLLGEHFASYVLAIEIEDMDSPEGSYYGVYRNGSVATCLGLCKIATDVVDSEIDDILPGEENQAVM